MKKQKQTIPLIYAIMFVILILALLFFMVQDGINFARNYENQIKIQNYCEKASCYNNQTCGFIIYKGQNQAINMNETKFIECMMRYYK